MLTNYYKIVSAAIDNETPVITIRVIKTGKFHALADHKAERVAKLLDFHFPAEISQ